MNELFPGEKKTVEETEMNVHSSNGNFVALYEDLRSQALNNITKNTGFGLGLGLFIQRGMVVWIKSWCTCKPKVTTTEVDQFNNSEQLCPLPLQDEVVTVLVNMALCHQEGGFHA